MSSPRTTWALGLFVITLFAPVGAAEEFPSQNATLLAQVPLSSFSSNPSSGNDCWGYTSPSGREYALMGLNNAVAVVEITDAANPVIVGSISHQSSPWGDIRTYDTYAYAVNESGGGLDVIDLSQVDQGVVTLVQRVTTGGLSRCHNLSLDTDSGFLYLCDSNLNSGRLIAMDLSDPSNPVTAGQTAVAGFGSPHDAQVVTYDSGPYTGLEIAFCSSGGTGLEIYDVTDKQAMTRLSLSSYPNQSYTHQAWLDGTRQYLYVNDETDGVNETVVFDVGDLTLPNLVGTYDSGVASTDHNLFWHQGRIYEAEYSSGLRIFDATNPIAPVQIGWLDTYPANDAGSFNGAWGTFPFFPSGKVIISDQTEGLLVVWPDSPPLTYGFGGTRAPGRITPSGHVFPVRIEAVEGSAVDPLSASLFYDFGIGAVEAPLIHVGGGDFLGVFDPMACGTIVEYYIQASTTVGVPVRHPAGAPTAVRRAVVAYQSSVVHADDAETDQGWVLGLPGDNAFSGQWERLDPLGTASQPEDDHTPGSGSTCFVTGQGSQGGSTGDDDVDRGTTSMMTPRIDLSGAQAATISYWRWFHNSNLDASTNENTGPAEDELTVWASDDDGQTWSLVETVGPTGSEAVGGWFMHAFDVGTFVDLTDEVRVRFQATDAMSPSVVEAAIDDLLVLEIDCNIGPPGIAPPRKAPRSVD